MSRIFGGCSSVSMVSDTAGLFCRCPSFGAFVGVHVTSCSPFQANPVGMQRGVPSVAT